jgi:Tol biopolymer transport system component
VFVRDRAAYRTIVVSRSRSRGAANGCVDEQIAAGGRYVVFSSGASTIVRGDTNGDTDVFVADLRTGAVRRVSTTAAGAQLATRSDQAAISGDGRLVAFHSIDAVPGRGEGVYLRDLRTGRVRRIGGGFTPSLSANGRVLAYAASDGVHAVELASGRDTLVGPGGDVLRPHLSRNGRTAVLAAPGDRLGALERRHHCQRRHRQRRANRCAQWHLRDGPGGLVEHLAEPRPSDTDTAEDVYLRP